MADGIWGNSFNTNTTNLTQFNVSNVYNRTYSDDEYPMLRNIQIAATTPDYVSVYKFLRGGGAAKDLSDYKSIRFTTGINTPGMNLRVTLTKLSVTGWSKQYTYLVNGMEDGKTYQIGLSEFKSADSSLPATIDASDITSVVYNIENPTGQTLSFSASINNASFSKTDIVYERTLQVKTVGVSPNPNNGAFKISFVSEKDAQLQLKVIDISGKLVTTQSISAVKGKNEVQIQLNQKLGGYYFINLASEATIYNTQRVLMNSK